MNRTPTLKISLALGLLCMQLGCPPSADVKPTAVLAVDSLPTEPEALMKIADEQFDSSGVGFRNAQLVLDRAVQKNATWAASKAGFDVQWRLAKAASEQCSSDETNGCTSVLNSGLAAAKKAVELEPERVEGHYYLAQMQGFSAQAQRGGDVKPLVLQVVQEAELATKLDPKFDYAGPHRLLGTIFARAPAPPVAVGDPEKAVQHLQNAVGIAADFPPNQVCLAEAQIADERYQDAEATLQTAQKLLANPKWEKKRDVWKESFSKVQRKLRAKQN
ncbi:MAG TPA: tetratricopeptide repeat protein [Pseudomonadota bacterium]|jgi:tetratricopeptide (TPR) repeat protein|nr:tetratricopeptide repeat protein [Pseudomonadota bacterium]